jgi:hypothetical protein
MALLGEGGLACDEERMAMSFIPVLRMDIDRKYLPPALLIG